MIALALLAAGSAANAARNDVFVPDELRPWVGWVLQDREYLDCPFFFDQSQSDRDGFICAWPGELELAVTSGGAAFSQPWTVYAGEQWVPLPGDGDVWPEQVTSNGQAAEVVMQGNTPSVRLAAGRYTLAGRFAWDAAPRVLSVPPRTGLLALTVGGSAVARPERGPNSVWLAPRESETKAEDRISVQVYREVADDVPTRLTTVFRIDVSGSVREAVLGPALPGGFVPLALESPLPARLEADGNLRLQVRPGSFEVRLLARGDGVLNEIGLQAQATNLPDGEIWSYRSNDRLRVTVPEGLLPVDPGQVSAPGEWLELPAFHIERGEVLRIAERSRGAVAEDNQLQLERRLWLDFDGGGFVFADSIGGSMQSGWRLDLVEPYVLLSASEGEDNLLVTLGTGEGTTGVELRRPHVDLQAIGRSETRGPLPVSGWQTRFDRVNATLNLPPGNKLFAAIGADRASGSWVQRWQLLDFFLVLIVTIATMRLFGREAGAIALLGLTLSWHEPGAAQWVWVNLLAAVALFRVAPPGRLKKAAAVYRGVSLAVLVAILLPFVAGQLRIAIYPQLEPQRGSESFAHDGYDLIQAEPPASAVMDQPERSLKRAAEADLEEIVVTGARAGRSYARYAPNAIVQAGPGKPSWSWNSYTLGFGGPVDAEQTLRLMVMPRWLVTTLRFAAVLLLLALAAAFASETFNKWRKLPWAPRAGQASSSLPMATMATMATMAIIAAGTLFPAADAAAQTPSPELLQQLERRLLEPPPCAPRCAEIAEARVTVGEERMTIVLEVHALENVAVPLPGSLQGWRPESVQLDDSPAEVYRRADQTLWVRAAAGGHRVTLQGPLPPVDSLEVPFPAAPRIITARSEGWSVAGIRERRLVAGALHLARLQTARGDGATARWDSARFPVFVRVERLIELDLDWRVSTQVVRVAPDDGAFSLDLPLLEGESIVSGDFQVVDGKVRVSMSPGQRAVAWESTLPRTSPFHLRADTDASRKEVWRFGVSSVWHVRFDGVPESESESTSGEARVVEFHPRAGETLTVEAGRPEASGGASLAFDRVGLRSEVGLRSRNFEMQLAYRSTRGAQHGIRLPDGAEVLSVTIDGRDEPLRPADGELRLPILPGEHEIAVRWRHELAAEVRTRTPLVDLAAPSSNIELGIELPQNRWVLATSGPRLGPAVLYWSGLAVLLLVAFVLGRVTLTPLAMHHWLLLGLGFSTFSWTALMLVTLWLLAVGARARWAGDTSWWRFDSVQLLLAAFTVAALAAIVLTVPAGLLGTPDMHVVGNNSWGNSLRWFADRSEGALPAAAVISLPMWVYKALILGWALWLSVALLRWLPWVWASFVSRGIWRSRAGRRRAGANEA